MLNLRGSLSLCIISLSLCLSTQPADAQYGGGTGEPNNPYLIYTAEQMNVIGAGPNDWDKHFKLMADIDLGSHTGTSFNIIGYWRDGSDNKPFSGVFDGNGHTISNFSYSSTDGDYIGLFGYVDGENAEIKNLRLISPNIDGVAQVGLLVGYLAEGSVTGCYVQGGSAWAFESVGGLVGENSRGTITNCYATAGVSGDRHVGGLVGSNEGGEITNCYSAGTVSADYGPVGGVAGHNAGLLTQCHSTSEVGGSRGSVGGLAGVNRGALTQCYSTGVVTGGWNVGGLVGDNLGGVTHCYSTGMVSASFYVGGLAGYNTGVLTQCYSTGAISGNWLVGGLVGSNGGDVTGCFWDIQTSGQTTSAGGTGLATAEMQDIQTYLNAGWDFVDEIENGTSQVWHMPVGAGYPVLAIFNGYAPPELQGLGTPEDAYLVSDAVELGAVVHYSPYAHYRLAASIDLTGIRWGTAVIPWLAGTFDGNDHTISHLTITSGGYLGLFGQLASGAEVKNLGVADANVMGSGTWIGALVGYNYCGDVTDCYSTGSVSGGSSVGGLVGVNYGSITTSYSTGPVTGNGGVGGLVGDNWGAVTQCHSTSTVSGPHGVGGLAGGNSGYMTRCHSTGTVDGGETVGGLLGLNWGGGFNCGALTQCYSTGAVSGNSSVGGLVGCNLDTVTQCYSTGAVNGSSDVGGLVGVNAWWEDGAWLYEGEVTSSFWDVETSGQIASEGGTSKTTAEMQTASTFTDAGWDFVGESENGTEDIWAVCEGHDYPRLTWQFVIGDFDGDADADVTDFCIFAGRWLQTDSSFWCGGGGSDLTNDGNIDFHDLIYVADNWLATK